MSAPKPTPFKNPRAAHGFLGRTCSIVSVGAYVPARILTNAELERMVNTSDEWITSRTGIRQRRMAADDEFTSDLASKAALLALERAQVKPEQIDLIIVATITPDMPFPSTACLVQRKIGARRAAAFDIEAACSGFIYGLLSGKSAEWALGCGVAHGALAMSTPGDTTMVTLPEVLRAMQGASARIER